MEYTGYYEALKWIWISISSLIIVAPLELALLCLPVYRSKENKQLKYSFRQIMKLVFKQGMRITRKQLSGECEGVTR